MKQPLLLAFATVLLVGCAPTLVPHTPYLPLIRNRGQAEARISTGFNGSELQAGYQATDRLVLHTALLTYGRSRNGDKFRSADVGFGYYYNSPNGFWRLGLHAGAAHGAGISNGGGCFECAGKPSPRVDYSVRYTYAYAQPTVLLLNGNHTWGFGLRVGRAYYHRLEQVGADTLGGQIEVTNYAGRQAAFMQPTFQYSYRAARWLSFSSTLGIQAFLDKPTAIGDMNSLVGQIGVHFTLHQLTKDRP